MYAAPKDVISRKIESLGDFSSMKTVGKKAKRIGLLFSTARAAMTISPDRVQDIPDIESADYIYTDGCGLISPRLASELARRTRIVFRDKRYTPSVFQIRYRGYKGVVTVDPTMLKKGGPDDDDDAKKILLKMRSSMRKFKGGDDHSFAVVEYSKPYSYGYLNDEVVVLLSALGIGREVFARKQEEHFEFLRDATRDPGTAFRFLSYVNEIKLAERVLMGDEWESGEVQKRVAKLVKGEYGKMLNKRDEQKCRILIPKSRLLFGVCDAWGVLKEGECAVKVTLFGDGQPASLTGMEVLVTRNPCLHPGDMQKFKVVQRPELDHLIDCIVFSTKGKRPAADLMSGGDLDGDTCKPSLTMLTYETCGLTKCQSLYVGTVMSSRLPSPSLLSIQVSRSRCASLPLPMTTALCTLPGIPMPPWAASRTSISTGLELGARWLQNVKS